MRLTIATPSAHVDTANHYAMVLGYSQADADTYCNTSWQDANGDLYTCASLPIGPNFVTNATAALVRPEWDTENIIDMTKAAQAQALVLLWMPNDRDPYPPRATPAQIVAILGMDGLDAIDAMGLTVIELSSDP